MAMSSYTEVMTRAGYSAGDLLSDGTVLCLVIVAALIAMQLVALRNTDQSRVVKGQPRRIGRTGSTASKVSDRQRRRA
jgi:hypothetical protein